MKFELTELEKLIGERNAAATDPKQTTHWITGFEKEIERIKSVFMGLNLARS